MSEPFSPSTPIPPPPHTPNENIVILQPIRADDIKRGPGRPRTKVNPRDVYPPPSSSSPSSPPSSPSSFPSSSSSRSLSSHEQDEKQRKRNAKQREVRDAAEKITSELNDGLLEAIIAIGVPAELLYKAGRTPKSKQVNSDYSELGNMLCINQMQANWIAHGWVEAKEVPAIKRWVGEGKADGPAYFWMVLGGIGVLSYVKQLSTAVKYLKDMKDALAGLGAVEDAQTAPVGPNFPGG